MIRILKIIILLELVFFQAHAQKYYIKHYDESDGCPRKLIVGLNQDKDGYLWLSLSGHGLMRFDGYDFELFDTKNKNQHIIEIFKDRKQNLRLGSYKGVLNLTENKIFTDSFTDSSFYARSFYQPNDSMTYMGSEFGKLAVYKDSALILEKKIGSRIGDIKGDNKGNIWFSTVKNEVWRYNQNGFKRFVFDPSSEDEQVWAIQIINNQVVASTLNQIRVFKDNKFVKWEYAEKLYKPYANYMFNDSRGRTWFLHLDAISIWDRGKLTVLKETNFSGMGLVTVFEDASGN